MEGVDNAKVENSVIIQVRVWGQDTGSRYGSQDTGIKIRGSRYELQDMRIGSKVLLRKRYKNVV